MKQILALMLVVGLLLIGGSVMAADIGIGLQTGTYPKSLETTFGIGIPKSPIFIKGISTRVDEIPMFGMGIYIKQEGLDIAEFSSATSIIIGEAEMYSFNLRVPFSGLSNWLVPYLGLGFSSLKENWGTYSLLKRSLGLGATIGYITKDFIARIWFECDLSRLDNPWLSWLQYTIRVGGNINLVLW